MSMGWFGAWNAAVSTQEPLPTALVVEAAEGAWRTVMAIKERNAWVLALPEGHPLCAALQGTSRVRVMEPDGRTFSVKPQDSAMDAAAQRLVTLVQLRAQGLRQAQGTPRLFKLVLDAVLGQENGGSPRT